MRALRVFWPREVANSGNIIGWRHEEVIVVATVVESESTTASLLELLSSYEKWIELKDSCKDPPAVLGQAAAQVDGAFSLIFEESGLNNIPAYFTYYSRPSLYQMRFFAVSPLRLDITMRQRDIQTESLDYHRINILMDPCRRLGEDYDLRCIAHQMNASGVVDTALRTGGHGFKTSPALPVFQSISYICNLPMPAFDSTNRLKDVSATIQQLDVRLEQFAFFPSQIELISTRSRRDIANYSAQYINFYNNIWLIFNDVVVGSAVGVILCENHQYFGRLLHSYIEKWTVHYINDSLAWLDNWPAGLKLNTELSRTLCLSFMILTTVWARALNALASYFPTLIYLIGISGRSGLTMTLSMISDIISLLTIHIYISYFAATAVCHRILLTAGSLWNLFRGKRYNVLQKRLDSWDYSLDQLLLGTMLFTLVTFLSPTILVYYGLFATARLAIILLHATLETPLAFMNHFPLFVLMLRIKDPQRLPGGLIFVPAKDKTTALEVKNVPIPFSGIFFQHLLLWGRVSSHYHPLRLLRHVVTATVINPIPRYSIRYSMLPTAAPSGPERGKMKVE